MLLSFGRKTVDPKGLPRIAVINFDRFSESATVYVLLAACTRAAVEKWAKRLGVDVTETDGYRPDERTVIAEAESNGYRLQVYTYVPAEAKAAGPKPAADTAQLHWPARGLRTTTSCQGEPLTVESFAASEAEVTCPGCRALLPDAPRETTGGAS